MEIGLFFFFTSFSSPDLGRTGCSLRHTGNPFFVIPAQAGIHCFHYTYSSLALRLSLDRPVASGSHLMTVPWASARQIRPGPGRPLFVPPWKL
jgi:hypothetical protein